MEVKVAGRWQVWGPKFLKSSKRERKLESILTI